MRTCLVLVVVSIIAAAQIAHTPQVAADTPKAIVPQYDEQGRLKRPTGFETWVFVGTSIGLGYRREVAQQDGKDRPTSGAGKASENAPANAKTADDKAPTPETRTPRPRPTGPGSFHNVYIQPEAYDHYLKTGQFPDLTMLAMDVFEGKDKPEQDIITRGTFSGPRRSTEFAVKNANRPDGSKTDWAYYAFDRGPQTVAEAFKDSACFDCHKKHGDKDNVWVQFYPILRDVAKSDDK